MKKLLMLVVPSLMALFLALTGMATPVHASAKRLPLLICTGTQTVNYTPGITGQNKPTHLVISDDYSSCLPIGTPKVTSGQATSTVDENTSCTAATDVVDNLVTYHWSPSGATSTIDFPDTNIDHLPGGISQVFSMGTVTDGLYKGHLAIHIVTLIPREGSCNSSNGVSKASGPEIMTII